MVKYFLYLELEKDRALCGKNVPKSASDEVFEQLGKTEFVITEDTTQLEQSINNIYSANGVTMPETGQMKALFKQVIFISCEVELYHILLNYITCS